MQIVFLKKIIYVPTDIIDSYCPIDITYNELIIVSIEIDLCFDAAPS
jgi:hypothetical protein